jgi:hypothetical protein
MSIKMKDLLKENFSGTLMGGFISRSPWHDNVSLSKIVKEKYGDVDGEKVDVKGLTTEISNYNALSESIFGKSNITQIAEKLSWIANQAKSHTLHETEDWFDKITVNRNMKELTGLSNQFKKVATEAQGLQERMGGLYEDMGHILGRYYEIHEPGHEEDEVSSEGKSYRDGGELEADAVQEGTYEDFFQSALKKWGVSSPEDLGEEDKVKFFDYVDKNWTAKKETD